MKNPRAIPALQDNYIWYIEQENGDWIVVDPGESQPVLNAIGSNCQISHIFITHHHNDHTGGIEGLKSVFPNAIVVGPKGASKFLDITVKQNDGIMGFTVHETPGHTLDHIIYVNNEICFLGDLLFKYGCGRVFEGDFLMMYNSLSILKTFDSEIMCYPAHEYTLSNLMFAKEYWPFEQIESEIKAAKASKITLPMQLSEQLINNPFLACRNFDEFYKLRKAKDNM